MLNSLTFGSIIRSGSCRRLPGSLRDVGGRPFERSRVDVRSAVSEEAKE